ncbi:hypothetical protein EI94DRAFT_1704901 [Lactarius quietus]|nr:hypothetical protein EI94DRAFT_1704901 [Lactarius quietus]
MAQDITFGMLTCFVLGWSCAEQLSTALSDTVRSLEPPPSFEMATDLTFSTLTCFVLGCCDANGCSRNFKSESALRCHQTTVHIIPHALRPPLPHHKSHQEREDLQPAFHDGSPHSQDEAPIPNLHYISDGFHMEAHTILDGTPCDIDRDDLEPGALPPPPDDHAKGDFSPFANHAEFELAKLLYVEAEMSVGKINQLLTLLHGWMPAMKSGSEARFKSLKAWDQADEIAKEEATHGAMFAPVVLGSDKTMVSMAAGQNDFYPLYASLASKEYADKTNLCKFHWQIFHTSLVQILSDLHPHMKTPRITHCCDADYLEQALLAGIVQGWCPICSAPHHDLDGELWDNHTRNLAIYDSFPLIKGMFKDHIVTWVEKYIRETHPPAWADKILVDIDRHIAAVPSFSELHHFHEGRRFKQWTGNDLKGLMKVYLPTIVGYIPSEMTKAVSMLIDFFYLV